MRETLETNALGPLHLVQVLLSLLKRGRSPRIVNMSSGMGALTDNDGGHAAYRMSKTLLNAVTAILAAELAGTVAVNSVCPSWVKTDMGGAGATRDVAEGADSAVWLARRTRDPDRQIRSRPRSHSLVTRATLRGGVSAPWAAGQFTQSDSIESDCFPNC